MLHQWQARFIYGFNLTHFFRSICRISHPFLAPVSNLTEAIENQFSFGVAQFKTSNERFHRHAADPLMHSTQVQFPSSTTKSHEIEKQICPVEGNEINMELL